MHEPGFKGSYNVEVFLQDHSWHIQNDSAARRSVDEVKAEADCLRRKPVTLETHNKACPAKSKAV